MFILLCDLYAIFCRTCCCCEARKAAAKHIRCSYCRRYSSSPSHLSMRAAGLPQDQRTVYCKAAARMLRNVRLQLEIAQKPNNCPAGTVRLLALSCGSLANFARPSCGSPVCEREIIVWTRYGCLTLYVILCDFVGDLPHGLNVASVTSKSKVSIC